MECPFMMKVRTTTDSQKLIITEFKEEHNHEVSQVLSTKIICLLLYIQGDEGGSTYAVIGTKTKI